MTDGTGKRSWETSTAYLIARVAAHNMNENELERRARRIAAIKMGLVRDVIARSSLAAKPSAFM
jgi:hypothetical protein